MTTLRTALFAAVATLPQVEGYAPDPALVGQGRSRSPESTVTMPESVVTIDRNTHVQPRSV